MWIEWQRGDLDFRVLMKNKNAQLLFSCAMLNGTVALEGES
ncbi:hypothetical protein [Citrobacter amalonaticus]|nr:hypothetical protein [Citrobacter amalonaticus]